MNLCFGEIISQKDTINVKPSIVKIQLSKKFIIPATIKIDIISGNCFLDSLNIDALNGIISGIVISDTVQLAVSYQYLKIDLSENRILNPYPEVYNPDHNPSAINPTVIEEADLKAPQQNLDFLKSGTLYRGVTLASEGGVSLQSGLNLELKGNLSENIAIKGALSDQNIPIQPEGNTQTLNEIDKVFIQLEMNSEDIIFGDYLLEMGKGKYGAYNRKLQGIYGHSHRGNSDITLGGAVSKGQFTTNKFNGTEGNQGPYQLTGKESETAIIVLAGTEKVWIDGMAMTRGENNDYIMDYSTGEISFTAKQLITSDSRITIDFQYSNLIYQKNIWYTESSVRLLNEKVALSAEFIKESDDKNNPLEIDFTKTDKQLLKSIGDNIDKGYTSTVTEDSNGVYIIEDSILVYQGEGAGTHSAIFYHIGNKGQYRKIYLSDRFYFEFVDKNNPNISETIRNQALYVPAKPIKLPTDHQLYHIATQLNPTKNLQISTEFAQSDFDLNTFSSVDDDDNRGKACNIDVNWQLVESNFGKLQLNANYNHENKKFNPVDRNHEIEYSRKWDLDADSVQGFQAYETTLSYNLDNKITVDISGAAFEKGNFSSNRYKALSRIRLSRLTNSEFYEEKIISMTNREWIRRKAFLEVDIPGMVPFVTLYHEKKNNSASLFTDFQFLEQSYGLRSNENKLLQWTLQQEFRTDEAKDSSGWIDNSKSRNLKLSGQISNWNTVSSKVTFAHRKKNYAQNIPNVNFSIMSLEFRQSPVKYPIRWDTNMKVEKEQSIKKEELYYFVGEGEGQYRYDSTYAEYVPHPQGSYLLRIVPSSIKIPVTNIENGLRLKFSGSHMKNPILKQLSLTTQVRLQQEIKDGNTVLRKWTWKASNADTTQAFFYRLIDNDLNFRIPEKRTNFRLRYRSSVRKSQQDVRGAENSRIDEYSAEYRGPLYRDLKTQSEIRVKQTERSSEITSLRNRDILAITSQNKFTYIFDRQQTFALILILSKDTQRDESKNVEAFLTGLRGEYELKIMKKGQIKIFSEYNNVEAFPKNTVIPYEMCQGKQVGNTFGIGSSAEYRIGKFISLRCNVESWSEPYLGLYHRGTIEVRAIF